jgi:hypothetical protein
MVAGATALFGVGVLSGSASVVFAGLEMAGNKP